MNKSVMNTKRIILRAIILMICVTFIQCKDKKKEEEDNCSEGRTGQLTMMFKMVHHSRPIPGCRVFIKYNPCEFPGPDTTKYDYAVSAEWNSAYASIDSLNCGRYYVYAIGIDSLLDPSDWICVGGLPFNTSMVSGLDSMNVYITEGD
ncbi:MAG: hypothetical protein IPO63_11865 [Bacteroidetes bacterium]|nr:hypothetical protein [Bacteroidota bacterium]